MMIVGFWQSQSFKEALGDGRFVPKLDKKCCSNARPLRDNVFQTLGVSGASLVFYLDWLPASPASMSVLRRWHTWRGLNLSLC